MKRNPGHQPEGTKGKRVMVKLVNGREPKESWPADPPTKWARTGAAFDIDEYEIV